MSDLSETKRDSSDLISRQSAIDALGEEPEVWTGKDEYAQGLNNQWWHDVVAIKAVPSAQPERKRGEWIRLDERRLDDGSLENWYCAEGE